MGRKRNYYREERKPARYRDDYYEEWDDDEEEAEPLDGDKLLKRGGLGILIFFVFGFLLWATQFFYSPPVQSMTGGYRVVSVSNGQLHTIEVDSGRSVNFADQDMVRKALRGDLKRGDVFYR
ncbi:hypothetical protein ACQCN2_01195 [Brevibacillus ginsengisoli]|uniref:hypothetical protein n=1 Tax=Brevibacillus ginsengisoli TaxID=363854 RepID=UPI003CECAC08